MIAIPIDKPKNCKVCPFTCEALQFFNGTDIPQSCPLIEIVQCKDCKWWDNNDDANRCTHECGGMWAKPNAFCSYGERRE
jgi:hypothetical protein